MSLLYKDKRPCGLYNMGYTCYMNTALQCLGACPPFLDVILRYAHFAKPTPSVQNVLLYQLSDVYDKLWNDQKSVKPKGLLHVLGKSHLARCMDLYVSNDLHEFLSIFIDELINAFVRHSPFDIVPVLSGTEVNDIVCQKCGERSSHVADFNMITLWFDQQHHLDSMLQQYFAEETIQDRECDFCRHTHVQGKKIKQVRKLPQVLCFLFMRYTDSYKRLNYPLDLPHEIDMSPYCEATKGRVFSLRSIACHYGSMSNGHYYTLMRHPSDKTWYAIDDEEVTLVKEEEARRKTRDFYCAFYT